MTSENHFEFEIEMALPAALNAALEAAHAHGHWVINEDLIGDNGFEFMVPPGVNPRNTSGKPYHYQISLIPIGTNTTKVMFSSAYTDTLSGSAVLEYNFLKSKMKRELQGEIAKGTLPGPALAEYMLHAPLYKAVSAVKAALRKSSAQDIVSIERDGYHEVFAFTFGQGSFRGRTTIQGLSALSRISLWAATDGSLPSAVLAFLERFTEHLGNSSAIDVLNTVLAEQRAVSDQPRQEMIASTRSIFISYRRDDSADVAGRIYDRLIGRYSRETIFKDVDTIPLGADFRKVISRSVERCDVLLAVIGRDWLLAADETGLRRLDNPTDFVRIEIETALRRDIPVIPVLVRGAHMPKEADLPQELASLVYRNAIQVRPDPDFHTDVDRLVKGLETLLGSG